MATNYSADDPNKVWFWTQSTFFLFQPINSLQFTSLLFTDPALKISNVSLYLQPGHVTVNRSISSSFVLCLQSP